MAEKQDKTFGSLSMTDKIYRPAIDKIDEFIITSIRIKDSGAILIKCGYREIEATKSQTVSVDDYDKKVCVNKQKAIEIQNEYRLKKLNYLKNEVIKHQQNLNEFIDKYFNHDNKK